MDDISTLTIEGFTPYAQVPRWVLRAGKGLSLGARSLYGVIMTYADNSTRAAFPSREKLASDLGVSTRSVSTYIKELEGFGALRVDRRRNKRTGNFYANHYVLVFADPHAPEPGEAHFPRREEADFPRTTPTVLPTPTSPVTADSVIPASGTGDPHGSTHTFGGSGIDAMSPQDRTMALSKLRLVGGLLNQGHDYYSEPVQEAWDDFALSMEEYTEDWSHNDVLTDLLVNGKWTVTKHVLGAYEAGTELNKMINTARTAY